MADIVDFVSHKAKLDTEEELQYIADTFEMMEDEDIERFVDDLAFMMLLGEPANDHETATILFGEEYEISLSDLEELFRPEN